jgi:hypothetical protein
MNGNMGASFALSFLLVGVVAVVLYRPETHPPSPAGGASIEVTATPESEANEPFPPLTPAVPWSDAPAPTEPAPASLVSRSGSATSLTALGTDDRANDPIRRPSLETRGNPTSDVPAPSNPAVRPVARRSISTGPHPPFTTSAAGETLADVARRIYGSAAAQDLWLANRDHIERPDAPLPAGTLLRTP